MLFVALQRYPLVWLLMSQLVIITTVSLLFFVEQLASGIALLAGGLAFWLPNSLFMLLALRFHIKVADSTEQQTGRMPKIAWRLMVSEAVKIMCSIMLLALALAGLDLAVVPLTVGWLLALVTQILVPMMINRF